MDRKIQRVLDGELSPAELSAAERARLAHTEAVLAQVVHHLPARQLPDLAPAVLRRIAQAQSAATEVMRPRSGWISRLRASFSWVWTARPVTMRLRPAYALVVVFALGVVVGRALLPETPAAAPVLVQFRLDAPGAERVALAGDFTKWKPSYTLRRSGPGVWTVVVPLSAGVHDYAFVVDGVRWVPDPMAPAVADGFGGLNSRLAVFSPDSRPRL